jgi:hypothetical protein
MTQMRKIIQEPKWLFTHYKQFLYHIPIYGQWATFIFQIVTYNFFLLILIVMGKKTMPFDNKIYVFTRVVVSSTPTTK